MSWPELENRRINMSKKLTLDTLMRQDASEKDYEDTVDIAAEIVANAFEACDFGLYRPEDESVSPYLLDFKLGAGSQPELFRKLFKQIVHKGIQTTPFQDAFKERLKAGKVVSMSDDLAILVPERGESSGISEIRSGGDEIFAKILFCHKDYKEAMLHKLVEVHDKHASPEDKATKFINSLE